MSEDKDEAWDAIRSTDDQVDLIKAAFNARLMPVRIIATSRLTDEDALRMIIRSSIDSIMCATAMSRLAEVSSLTWEGVKELARDSEYEFLSAYWPGYQYDPQDWPVYKLESVEGPNMKP